MYAILIALYLDIIRIFFMEQKHIFLIRYHYSSTTSRVDNDRAFLSVEAVTQYLMKCDYNIVIGKKHYLSNNSEFYAEYFTVPIHVSE